MRLLITALSTPSSLRTSIRIPHTSNGSLKRQCSCTARLRDAEPTTQQDSPSSFKIKKHAKSPVRRIETTNHLKAPPVDHQTLATKQGLFITSPYSPGSPLLLPNGTDMFLKLSDFLRAQYAQFGFREVITPTIYKKSLWEKSGHWDNYKDDMFEVKGRSPHEQHASNPSGTDKEIGQDEEFGLKPMNCPGHCLLFDAQRHSYRDLPIRYADFSALHRNEISGSLSGLTRVRRFHQDDAHIFCRPSQIEDEIRSTMAFVELVYSKVFDFGPYKLFLSTRPEKDYIGSLEEWDRAETQLKSALDSTGQDWQLNPGDGAFYGPKIDIVLKDAHGKQHQTATIQLDFQLPQRFDLSYAAPAPDLEVKGAVVNSYQPLDSEPQGQVRPVMIHRAILGSLERFMALLIEHYNGVYPFWLAPRPCMVMNISSTPEQITYAKRVAASLGGQRFFAGPTGQSSIPKPGADTMSKHTPAKMASMRPRLNIELDGSSRSVGKKMLEAEKMGYNVIVLVGPQEVAQGTVSVKICHSQRKAESIAKMLMSLLESKDTGHFTDGPRRQSPPRNKLSDEQAETGSASQQESTKSGTLLALSDGVEGEDWSKSPQPSVPALPPLPEQQGDWMHLRYPSGEKVSFGRDAQGQIEVRGLRVGTLRRLFKKLQDGYM